MSLRSHLAAASSLLVLFSLAACSQSSADSDEAESGEGAQSADIVAAGSLFNLNDGYMTGSLNVSAADATKLTFELSLVQASMPHNMGDLSGVAKGANGHYVYEEEDCKLDLKVQRDTIEATQEGSCSMGHNVFANGSFKKWVGLKDKLANGHYDNLTVAVNGGLVTGYLRDSIGDPAHGGATCEFSFAGKVSADQRSTNVTVTDGYETLQGKLMIRDRDNIALSLPSLPNACSRMLQEDEFKKPEGYAFKWAGLANPKNQAYRTVAVDKAFFHDSPSAPARRAYVVKGDTVIVTGGDASFPEVRFNPYLEENPDTLGFIAGSDLVALPR